VLDDPRHDKEVHHDGKAEGVWVKGDAHIVESPNGPQQRPRARGVICKQRGPAGSAARGG
jgi:hypothetical protein